MEEFKNIEIDEQDIGVILSAWLYLGFLLNKETVVGNLVLSPPEMPIEELKEMLLKCGADCFKNIESFFEKHGIPKEFALHCHHKNLELSGMPGAKEYGEGIESKTVKH